MNEREKKVAKEYLLSSNDGKMLGPFVRAYGFFNGLSAVEFPGDGKMCYIDFQGNKAVPASFDEAYPFADGVALVENNGKKYFVHIAGEKVLEPELRSSDLFRRARLV